MFQKENREGEGNRTSYCKGRPQNYTDLFKSVSCAISIPSFIELFTSYYSDEKWIDLTRAFLKGK